MAIPTPQSDTIQGFSICPRKAALMTASRSVVGRLCLFSRKGLGLERRLGLSMSYCRSKRRLAFKSDKPSELGEENGNEKIKDTVLSQFCFEGKKKKTRKTMRS